MYFTYQNLSRSKTGSERNLLFNFYVSWQTINKAERKTKFPGATYHLLSEESHERAFDQKRRKRSKRRVFLPGQSQWRHQIESNWKWALWELRENHQAAVGASIHGQDSGTGRRGRYELPRDNGRNCNFSQISRWRSKCKEKRNMVQILKHVRISLRT